MEEPGLLHSHRDHANVRDGGRVGVPNLILPPGWRLSLRISMDEQDLAGIELDGTLDSLLKPVRW
jgi:hypothetical protein